MHSRQVKKQTRYAYIKNGDVVDQIERITGNAIEEVANGPDAFICSFLKSVSGQPVLLLSRHRRNARYFCKDISAKVFYGDGSVLRKIVSRPLIFVQVLTELIGFRPDRILCGATGSMLWASSIVSWLYSVPLVHSRHNLVDTGHMSLYQRIRSNIDKWCLKNAVGIICHGPFLQQQLIDAGIPVSKIFEFDVRFPDIVTEGNAIRGNQSLEGRKSDILYIGRIEVDKGVFDLLEACSERLKKDHTLRLVYAGKGSALDRLNRTIDLHGLNESVVTLGGVPHEELPQLFDKSKVVVTPTRGEFPEGRCMVAMEALVDGVPVIAPDFGPFPYLVKDGVNGFLYETNSVLGLREAILRLLDDKELWAKIHEGAIRTGRELCEPPLTFGQAVRKAFLLRESKEAVAD